MRNGDVAMNEFTKEELEAIFYCIDMVKHQDDEYPEFDIMLNKIQCMIDNYCDHECSNHQPIRLKLLSGKEYDFCETCLHIKRMR